TLRLLSAAAADSDSSTLPAGVRPAEHPDDPFYRILSDVEHAARNPARPRREAVIRFADDAIAAKRPLDAIMALLEFGLQSGEQLTDDLRRHREIFNRDAACQAYLGAMRPSDKAAAEKSLAANAALDRRGLAKAHMLDLQRANLLEQTGQPRQAVELYFKVLRANPHHAGALHDLGLNLARGFEPAKAWQCWDAARRLYPAHPMMRDIIRIEQDLLRNEPDFF
ncbi:MAG: hypothetical protein HYV75_03645, partial [Opitutae bacterium]|nr:hypothetical protein [Opitutae bacterium]